MAPFKRKAEVEIKGMELLKQEFGEMEPKIGHSPRNLEYLSEQYKTPIKGGVGVST
jgi:hypothetical protein